MPDIQVFEVGNGFAGQCARELNCQFVCKLVADLDTHSRETSSSISLSDDFSTQVKTNMDNTSISTDYYVKRANKHLEEMAKHPNLTVSWYGNHIADAH